MLPGSSGSVEIPGTSIATHFAFWDLIDHTGWHELPGPSRLSSVGAAASQAVLTGMVFAPCPLKVPGG